MDFPQVTVAGCFQNGKSTLLNCLLDDKYAPMGKGVRTTACCSRFFYGEAEIVKLVHDDIGKEEVLDRIEAIFQQDFRCSPQDHIEITCWKPLLKRIVLVDTPGFDANQVDDHIAQTALEKAAFILFLHDSRQLDQCSIRILQFLRSQGKRILFLMNCKNEQHWAPQDPANDKIRKTLEVQLKEIGMIDSLLPIQECLVWPCNPVFSWYAQGHLQRDLDNRDDSIRKDAEELLESIDYFCKKKKWSASVQKDTLLKHSGILEIRKAVEEAAITPLKMACNNPMAEIKTLAELWSNRISGIIKNKQEGNGL